MERNQIREKYLRTLSERLCKTISSEQLYILPHLSLADVAVYLGASRRDLSCAIKKYQGKSFVDFINEERIKEVVRLMRRTDVCLLRIDDIAREVGFSDRTTFFRACKKLTGLSPTELKEQVLNTSDRLWKEIEI